MKTSRTSIIIGAVLLCGIATLVQFFMRGVFGWSIDTVLATLLVSALFLGPITTGMVALIAADILGSPAMFSPETVMLIGLPVILSMVHKKMPWQHLLLVVSVVFVGVVLFYVVVNWDVAYANAGFIAEDALLASVFGSIVFAVLFSLRGDQ